MQNGPANKEGKGPDWRMSMKKYKYVLTLSVLMLLLTAAPIFNLAQDQERIVEKVTVTNVEVPVRVLFKGKPVDDLTKDDFILYENKKKVQINGFYKIRKTLSLNQTGEAKPEPRTFVLVFNVSNYNEYFEKALDHLFANILLPSDRLLVFANDTTREYPELKDKDAVKAQLVADLKEEGIKAKRRLLEYINRVETFLNVHDFRRLVQETRNQNLQGRGPADEMIDFMKKYFLTWSEYQQTYLIPRTDRFYFFARYLEKLKGRKWVFNFYQFEFFPRIRPGSQTWDRIRDLATELQQSNNPTHNAQANQIFTLFNKINSELALNARFPKDEISKLFYKVDATFHSFFIKSSSTAFLQDIEYDEVSSEVEHILKSITDITGGKNITSTDLVQSLETVKEVEDVYYMLTYVPKNRKKSGVLDIKIKRGKKYKALFDDNFRADWINDYFAKLEQKVKTPDIKVGNFSFKDKLLVFTISDYMMTKIEGKMAGRLKVRIRITGANNNPLYDKSNYLTAQKKDIKISLPNFKTIIKGEYNFLIDVQDLVTGKEDGIHHAVTIEK